MQSSYSVALVQFIHALSRHRNVSSHDSRSGEVDYVKSSEYHKVGGSRYKESGIEEKKTKRRNEEEEREARPKGGLHVLPRAREEQYCVCITQ